MKVDLRKSNKNFVTKLETQYTLLKRKGVINIAYISGCERQPGEIEQADHIWKCSSPDGLEVPQDCEILLQQQHQYPAYAVTISFIFNFILFF